MNFADIVFIELKDSLIHTEVGKFFVVIWYPKGNFFFSPPSPSKPINLTEF